VEIKNLLKIFFFKSGTSFSLNIIINLHTPFSFIIY
jgi:hypothetical protein